MEAHHASLGRRTLEEIRQKRAAERLQKAPSDGSDVESYAQRDSHALLARFKELEGTNADLERENQKLLSKIEEKDVEKDALVKRLNDLERNSLPSLKKALNDVSLEKDAAVVAKEDALSQLRTAKKRLKEAEEEQYRAEEDAAALRAELNALQQQAMDHNFGGFPMVDSSDQTVALEREILELQTQIKQESLLRQQEQQKLAEEQLRTSSLMAEKQTLEEKLAALMTKASEEASDLAARKQFSTQDKEKLENQLHDMALMVERLEGSRQKLLMEIDSQSSEIEKLFEENSSLSTSYQEAMAVAMQWENQVKDCLRQNEELRSHLDELRLGQASRMGVSNNIHMHSQGQTENSVDSKSPELVIEILSLKDQLIKEQSRSEGLAAEVMKLSAELKRAVQLQNNLTRLYRPVLKDIENNLMKMKQETYATIQ